MLFIADLRLHGAHVHRRGRVDDLLKVAGRWVSPLEIEDALLTHPSVGEVCVVGRPDESGLPIAVAPVVPSAAPGAGAPRGGGDMGEFVEALAPSRLQPPSQKKGEV